MLEEFKKFINARQRRRPRGRRDHRRGVRSHRDMAIVTSLVSDIITSIIGAITGGLDFSNYYLPLSMKV